MTNYRRNFARGGTYFFTVNLEDRRLSLLTDHIDRLRAAFRYARQVGHTRHSIGWCGSTSIRMTGEVT
jgi:REP element-mobilizing transposase RayT